MGFAHLLKTDAALATSRARFDIPLDVHVGFYLERNIENDRHPQVMFFSFSGYFRRGGGGLGFPWTPYYLGNSVSTAFVPTNSHQTFIEW